MKITKNTSAKTGAFLLSALTLALYSAIGAAKPKVDLDGDAKADIVWQSDIFGEVWWWPQAKAAGGFSLGKVDSEWKVQLVADLDGDGRSDIVWRSWRTGELYYWMGGLRQQERQGPTVAIDSGWLIKGAGDFNADGKQDILWRNQQTGENALLVGDSQRPWFYDLQQVKDQNWQPTVIADLNADGKDDILWVHASDQREVYLWSGANAGYERAYAWNQSDAQILAGGVDASNHPAILARYPNALKWLTLDHQAGTVKTEVAALTDNGANLALYPSLQIAQVDDYAGDGKSRLFWRNLSELPSFSTEFNSLAGTEGAGVSSYWQPVGSPVQAYRSPAVELREVRVAGNSCKAVTVAGVVWNCDSQSLTEATSANTLFDDANLGSIQARFISQAEPLAALILDNNDKLWTRALPSSQVAPQTVAYDIRMVDGSFSTTTNSSIALRNNGQLLGWRHSAALTSSELTAENWLNYWQVLANDVQKAFIVQQGQTSAILALSSQGVLSLQSPQGSWQVVLRQVADLEHQWILTKEQQLYRLTSDGTLELQPGKFTRLLGSAAQRDDGSYWLLTDTSVQPFVAQAKFSGPRLEIPATATVFQQVRASASDDAPYGTVLKQRVDFGDGTAAAASWTHRYTNPGRYQVKLQVEYANGQQVSRWQQIDVVASATPQVQGVVGLIDDYGWNQAGQVFRGISNGSWRPVTGLPEIASIGQCGEAWLPQGGWLLPSSFSPYNSKGDIGDVPGNARQIPLAQRPVILSFWVLNDRAQLWQRNKLSANVLVFEQVKAVSCDGLVLQQDGSVWQLEQIGNSTHWYKVKDNIDTLLDIHHADASYYSKTAVVSTSGQISLAAGSNQFGGRDAELVDIAAWDEPLWRLDKTGELWFRAKAADAWQRQATDVAKLATTAVVKKDGSLWGLDAEIGLYPIYQ